MRKKAFVIIFLSGGMSMTIKDIAKMAKVSTATVSRVMNNTGYVSEETRRRVLEVLERTNFTPNAVARSLSTKATKVIAVVVPDIENDYFSKVVSGISSVASRYGYTPFFLASNENVEEEIRLLEVIMQQRMDGLIITPVSENSVESQEMLDRVALLGIPIVLVDRDSLGGNFSGVFVENEQASFRAVKALTENGHRDIAIIAGPRWSKPGRERLEGYLKALSDAGIPVREDRIVEGNFKIDGGCRAAKKILAMHPRPTAIFSSNNLMSVGCVRYILQQGLKIGEDIAMIGFDDIEFFEWMGLGFSAISRDACKQGIRTMEILAEQMSKPLQGAEQTERTVQKCRLILRGSERMSMRD